MFTPQSNSYLCFLQQPCSDLMRLARYVGYGTNVSLIATCTNSIFMLMAQFLPASIVGGKQARMAAATTYKKVGGWEVVRLFAWEVVRLYHVMSAGCKAVSLGGGKAGTSD